MPIDLSTVDWLYVAVLAVLAFFATVVGNLLSFNHRGIAAFFLCWTYYPHGLPLPTSPARPKAAVAVPAPVLAPPAASTAPRNPVSTIYEAPAAR